jgi:nitroreductase
MPKRYNEADDAILAKIMGQRRSVRDFSGEVPEKCDIEKIVYAGLLAPYAAAAIQNIEGFRRFVAIKGTSPKMSKINELIKQKARETLEEMRNQTKSGPLPPYASRLENIAKNGMPGFGKVPYYIVVCEQKGIPRVEQQSLAHILQNMWLRATSLGLGFQLISVFANMSDNKEFCELLGIPLGKYAVNGCAVGVPQATLPQNKFASIKDLSDFLAWIE